jgi:hypothetical protein
MRLLKLLRLVLLLAPGTLSLFNSRVATAQEPPSRIGEGSAIEEHVNQIDIESGKIKFDDLLEIGEGIFVARWTSPDGQGCPAATGAGTPAKRNPLNNIPFIRTSGPDVTSCADCHHHPAIGGAGGEFSNERNTLWMNGSEAVEMLAREMTGDFQSLRQLAIRKARQLGGDYEVSLITKGLSFGQPLAPPTAQLTLRRSRALI